MRTVIAGSRDVTNYADMLDALEHALLSGICPSIVISGTARGADTLGEQWATEFSIPIERYPADWNQYGKRAGYVRNVQMAECAEAVIVVWDGESKGTKHMIDIARKYKLQCVIWNYKLHCVI